MAAGVTFVASAFVSTPVEDEALSDQLTLGFESRAATRCGLRKQLRT
jgi:hypothetical protein